MNAEKVNGATKIGWVSQTVQIIIIVGILGYFYISTSKLPAEIRANRNEVMVELSLNRKEIQDTETRLAVLEKAITDLEKSYVQKADDISKSLAVMAQTQKEILNKLGFLEGKISTSSGNK